jgi:predicted permease
LTLERYKKDTMDTVRFADQVLNDLKSRAGIEAAAFAGSIPLQNNDPQGQVQIEGQPVPINASDSPSVLNTCISPSFRRTLQIPLVAGRDLDEPDNRDGTTTILVNAAFARRFFPNESAVGKRLRLSPVLNPSGPWIHIVGVVKDVQQNGLETVVEPELYMPLAAAVVPFPAVIIRTANSPMLHLRDVEDAVRQADVEVPVFMPRTMEQVGTSRLALRTFNTALIGALAAVALLLACGGIFAVIAYSVSQRTSEIGIRISCGASPGDIVWMIVKQALTPALAGIAIGVLASLFVNRFLESLLFGVKTTDVAAYIVPVLLLAVFSTLAALLPARRASRVQPWRALRYE